MPPPALPFRVLRLIPSLVAVAVCLSACSDPYQRPGTWHATGVNEANLRAMLANPGDLAWGRSDLGSDGQLAAAAVARLREDRVKPLPDATLAKVGTGGAAQGTAAPASSGPGTATPGATGGAATGGG